MKQFLTSLALAMIALPLLATSTKELVGPKDRAHQTRMLHQLLQMEDTELAELRQTVERIEKMSSEEKELLCKRIGKLQQMPPEHIEAIRQKFEAIPKETRNKMRDKWMTLSPEERREWRSKLRDLSKEERFEIFETEGFLPSLGRPTGKPLIRGQKPPRENEKKDLKKINP